MRHPISIQRGKNVIPFHGNAGNRICPDLVIKMLTQLGITLLNYTLVALVHLRGLVGAFPTRMYRG